MSETAIAKVGGPYENWLRSPARALNLTSAHDKAIAYDIFRSMEDQINNSNWLAASSNNLYWDRIDSPVRLIVVEYPDKDGLVGIVNPEIEKRSIPYFSFESCAGLGESDIYRVTRCARVHVNGFDPVDFERIELHYDLKEPEIKEIDWTDDLLGAYSTQKALHAGRLTKAAAVQHEIDHLDGILISDIGTKVE